MKRRTNSDSKMPNFNYEVQNCKWTKIQYLEHYVCSGIELTCGNILEP